MTENDAATRVGWIGLGAMGFPMAGCVARAGFDVSAYDINPARAEALTTEGVKPAASINEAASGADVFIIMVATPDQVESVLFGDEPATAALTAGAAVVGGFATLMDARGSYASRGSRPFGWGRSGVRAREEIIYVDVGVSAGAGETV